MLRKIPLEALWWATALLLLYFFGGHSGHFTLCPLSNLGITWCPGCGLGRSIHAVLHGNLHQSLLLHPLGIFAVLILSYRLLQLFYHQYFFKTQ